MSWVVRHPNGREYLHRGEGVGCLTWEPGIVGAYAFLDLSEAEVYVEWDEGARTMPLALHRCRCGVAALEVECPLCRGRS